MLLIFGFLKVLALGFHNKNITIKNVFVGILPFIFMIGVFSFELSYTYRLVVYFFIVFLSLFNFYENKFDAIRYTVYVVFLDISLTFLFRGSELYDLLFQDGVIDIYDLRDTIIITVLWILVTEVAQRFSMFQKKYSYTLEINIIILSTLILLGSTVLLDLSDLNYVYGQISGFVYLIILLYLSMYSVGNIVSFMYNHVMASEHRLQNDINQQKTKLAQVLSSQENFSIEFLSSLIVSKNYDDALEYTDKILLEKQQISRKMVQLTNIEVDILRKFLQARISNVYNIDITLDITTPITTFDIVNNKYAIEILGIIIDNAIEASMKSQEKIMNIKIEETEENETIFEITNSCNEHAKENLENKQSDKGDESRMNGLKILDVLLKRSSIHVIKVISDVVTYKVFIS